MSEEFKGDLPKINITDKGEYVFTYWCAETNRTLFFSCIKDTILSDECFDCIGMNTRFAKYFKDNRHCSCGYKVDFGYFVLIYYFEKAGILPDDFKMMCCKCYRELMKKKVIIDG